MRNTAAVAVPVNGFEFTGLRQFAERYMAKGREEVHAYENAIAELHAAESNSPSDVEEAIKLENWRKAYNKNMLYGSFFSVEDVL